MSLTKSNSTERSAEESNPSPWRSSVALVAVTLGLLGALVWALTPAQPHMTPAPLRPVPPGCPQGPPDFTPSNITEIPELHLDSLERAAKNRALLQLNMEPCPCGCGLSLAACRVLNPACEVSRDPAKKIVAEERGEPAEKP